MDYITINTPENIEIKYRLSGLGSRMAAYIVDLIILSTVVLIFTAIVISAIIKNISLESILDTNDWALALYILIVFSIYFGYFIISELTMKGQSLGKKLFKLRVIKENGQPLNFQASLVRNLFRYFVDNLAVGVFSILFSKKCKRVGDMVASTVVIAEDTNIIKTEDLTLSSLIFDKQQIIMDEKYNLTYDEYNLLKEYFNRKDKFIDGGKKSLESLSNYFTKKFNLNDGIVNEDVLHKLLCLNRK